MKVCSLVCSGWQDSGFSSQKRPTSWVFKISKEDLTHVHIALIHKCFMTANYVTHRLCIISNGLKTHITKVFNDVSILNYLKIGKEFLLI